MIKGIISNHPLYGETDILCVGNFTCGFLLLVEAFFKCSEPPKYLSFKRVVLEESAEANGDSSKLLFSLRSLSYCLIWAFVYITVPAAGPRLPHKWAPPKPEGSGASVQHVGLFVCVFRRKPCHWWINCSCISHVCVWNWLAALLLQLEVK